MEFWSIAGVGFFAIMGGILFGLETGVLKKYPAATVGGLAALFAGFVAVLIITYDPYDWSPFEDPMKQAGKQEKGGGGSGNNGGDGGNSGGGGGGGKKQAAAGDKAGSGEDDGGSGQAKSNAASVAQGRVVPKRERIKDCDVCPVLVIVPAGAVKLGSPQSEPGRQDIEGPRHKVTFKKRFAIGRFEIRRDEYQAFIKETDYKPASSCRSGDPAITALDFHDPGFEVGPSHPAVCLTRVDALHYVAWLTEKTGNAYRLPSAAQWEYAARGNSETAYSFGPEIGASHAHFGARTTDEITGGTRGAGSYAINPFDMLDVHGNVAEWVDDCWHNELAEAPQNGVALNIGFSCQTRIIKDGAWYEGPEVMRSASRRQRDGAMADNGIGFRVAREVKDKSLADLGKK